MSVDAWISVAILAVAALLFYKRSIPQEVVALAIPLTLFVTGVLDKDDARSGFGSEAVITIAAIFVVGAGIQEAGITRWLADVMERAGGRSLPLLVLALTSVSALVSGFMSTAAVIAAFTPAAMRLGRRTGHPPSKLLMPLAFGGMLGCNFLLISSLPTMLVAGYASQTLGSPMGIFDFTPGGVLIAVVGIAVIVLIVVPMLPVRSSEEGLRAAVAPEEAATRYGLGRTLFRMKLVGKSTIVGKTIADAGLRERYGLGVVAVGRTRMLVSQLLDPKPDLVLAEGDDLFVEGDDEAAFSFSDGEVVHLALAGPREIDAILGRGMALAEVTLSPRSTAVGRTIKQMDFRAKFGLNVLGIWRRGTILKEGLADEPFELGDAFLVSGRPEGVALLGRDPDWVVLTEPPPKEDASRAPLALLLFAVAVLPPIFVPSIPLWITALLAGLLMIVTGCLSAQDARNAVDLRILALTIGLLPLGLAIQKHGVAEAAAKVMLGFAEPIGPAAILAALFILAMAVALFTTNSAAAVVVMPIAATVATSAHIPLTPTLLAVAYGANSNFLLPFSAANLMVMGPGGYLPRDYLRAGGILTLAIIPVAVLALWLSLH